MAVGFLGVGAVITRGDVGSLVHGGVGGGEALVLAGWEPTPTGHDLAAGYSPNGYEVGGALLAVGALVAVTTLNRIQASALVGAAPAASREKRAPRPRGAEPATVSIR
jgi:hypothetical protein